MLWISQSGAPNQQSVDMHKHCILVAASNPYPLQTPVYVPRPQNLEQSETIDLDSGSHLYDAEAVAKAFPQVFFIYFNGTLFLFCVNLVCVCSLWLMVCDLLHAVFYFSVSHLPKTTSQD